MEAHSEVPLEMMKWNMVRWISWMAIRIKGLGMQVTKTMGHTLGKTIVLDMKDIGTVITKWKVEVK